VILSEADAKSITAKIMALSKADSCIVTLDGSEERHVRFAQNMATTNGSPSSLDVSVESHFGKKSGAAAGTDLSDDALAALVAASENTAKLAPENPEFMPPIGPQKYRTGTAFSRATQAATSVMLAAAIQPVLQQAQAKNLQASGFLNVGTAFSSFANSKGLFVYDQETDVLHTVTARTPDGTGAGWAGTTHSDFSKLDVAGLGAVAIDKAVRSQNPVRLPPGTYTVILEPSAVSDLLSIMIEEFDQRSADEGRSFATKKGGGSRLGENVFGKNVTLYSDPNDPLVPGGIYSDDGLPAQRTVWIDGGVLKNLQCSRYWAQKA
jgi:predicted Zn-dependent protease